MPAERGLAAGGADTPQLKVARLLGMPVFTPLAKRPVSHSLFERRTTHLGSSQSLEHAGWDRPHHAMKNILTKHVAAAFKDDAKLHRA